MASIWTQGPGCAPVKVKGYIPEFVPLVRAELQRAVERMAKANNATVVLDEPMEVHLKWSDGKIFAVWSDFCSVPSKAEPHEPRPKVENGK